MDKEISTFEAYKWLLLIPGAFIIDKIIKNALYSRLGTRAHNILLLLLALFTIIAIIFSIIKTLVTLPKIKKHNKQVRKNLNERAQVAAREKAEREEEERTRPGADVDGCLYWNEESQCYFINDDKSVSNRDFSNVRLSIQPVLDEITDISGTNFSGCDMHCSDFRKTIAKGAFFRGTNLDAAEFNGINLEGADFSNSNINRCHFDGANARGAIFKGAMFYDTSFKDTDLTGADLSYIDFKSDNSIFRAKSIAGAVFIGAKFCDMSLEGIDLSGLDLRGADFTKCNLTNANFNEANLEGACFDNADLSYASFSNANIKGCRFNDTYFYGNNMEKAIADGGHFAPKEFKEVDLSNASLKGARFERANSTPSYSSNDFYQVKFDSANLDGSEFIEIQMMACSFRFATLTNVFMQNIYISDVTFWGAKMKKVSFYMNKDRDTYIDSLKYQIQKDCSDSEGVCIYDEEGNFITAISEK